MHRAAALFAFVALAASSCAPATPSPGAPQREYQLNITRDAYGVPTAHGRDDAEAAYSLAYAHAEDNYETIELVLLAARGKLGAHLGEGGGRSDFLWHLLGIRDAVAERYETDLSPELRAVLEGYAAGLAAYQQAYPEEVSSYARNPTGRDIAAGSALTVPLFWGFERVLGRVVGDDAEPCTVRGATAESLDWGSNAFAVAPSRSDDGHTRLIVNSHQPWSGPVAWYEAGVQSDTGWRLHGGVFPGAPFPVLGTNGDIGWAATVNLPDLADIYRLTIDRHRARQYYFDGEWRRFETRHIWIDVKVGPFVIPIPRTLRYTVHGPAFETANGWVAVRYAGAGEIRAVEQFFRLGRAHNYDEWREAMEMRAIPSFNFIFADRTGRIAYHYNAILPRRAEGYDWSGCVPGDTSETLWAQGEYHDAPTLVDPSSGWLYSTNGAPWSSTDPDADLRASDYADAAPFIETYITNRGHRAVDLLAPLRTISDEQLLAAKFDLVSSERSATMAAVNAILSEDASDDAELAEIQALLRGWDRRAANDSPAAALAGMIYQPIYNAGRAGTAPPDPVDAAREAAAHLRTHFGRLDPPLGDLLRLRRGGVDLPLEGAPDVLRALRWAEDPDGRLRADFGDGLMMVMDWAPDGTLNTRIIHQFGASDRPDSPHFADQAPLFARYEWRTVDVLSPAP